MPASEVFFSVETNTKKEEQNIIEDVLLRLQYANFELTSYEQPDFSAMILGQKVGIEVTKYYCDFGKKGSKTQKKISEWINIAKSIRELLVNENPKYENLYGAIHFQEGFKQYKDLLNTKFMQELLFLVKEYAPAMNEQITVTILENDYPNLYQIIESIYLSNFVFDEKYLWWDSGIQSGKILNNPVAVRNIIEKKETSAKKYDSEFSQKWLIISAGGTGLHDIYAPFSDNIYRQGNVTFQQITGEKSATLLTYEVKYFSHVLLWDQLTEIIYLLHPYPKVIFDNGKIHINHLPITEKRAT